jgi:23S rRNA pseudouridine1911/1915/1917 synthase
MTPDPRDGSFSVPNGAPPDRLDRVLKGFRPALSWAQVRDLIARGKVLVDDRLAKDEGIRVVAGSKIEVKVGAARLPTAAAVPVVPAFEQERVVFSDRHLVVVNKPAGLDTVPWGDAADALDRRLAQLLGCRIHVVHRLDRDTTGLLMFARSEEAAGKLEHQLRRHTVHRRYLALAHGEVQAAKIQSFLAEDRGDGLRGSVTNHKLGKEAITHVQPVEFFRDATLVSCQLETGRTHQIRIHLAEQGHMLLGERGYVREHRGPALPAPRILLHAAELGFVHPVSGAPMKFALPLPLDMQEVMAQLAPRV